MKFLNGFGTYLGIALAALTLFADQVGIQATPLSDSAEAVIGGLALLFAAYRRHAKERRSMDVAA